MERRYQPGLFEPDEVIVDPISVFGADGAVNRDFRPDYTDESGSLVASSPNPEENSSRWKVSVDLGDLSGRGKPTNGNMRPNLSKTAVITTTREDFPRNA